jgi:hypothetical protein
LLLRESSEQDGAPAALAVVTGSAEGPAGVEHDALLIGIAEAVVAWDWARLESLKQEGVTHLGVQQTADAIGIACAFNGITKVADATGIPLDESTFDRTVEMRDTTGIDTFAPREKWAV